MKMVKRLSNDSQTSQMNGDGSGLDDTADETVASMYNYVRRRKCNENAPVCEKQKRRDNLRRVNYLFLLFLHRRDENRPLLNFCRIYSVGFADFA